MTALKYEDLVQDTTDTTGTGPFVMANAAPTGFRPFSVHAVGDSFPYAAKLGAQWEIGLGTMTDATHMTRAPLKSSNGNALVDFAAGTKTVIEDMTAYHARRLASADSTVTTAVGNVGTWTLPLYDAAGTPLNITIANLLAAIGQGATQLPAAGTLTGTHILTVTNSDGTDAQTTLSALQTFLGGASVPASDTTAPTLTSPTGSATGTTTASGTVSTNEANGTLYFLAATSSSATASAVKAGGSQAVTTSGGKSVSVTGLSAGTLYYLHYLHRDAAGNDSTVATSASFTTASAGDTTAPILSAPLGAQTGSTTASGGVTTNEANGTLYRMVSANATETAATIKAANLTTTVSTTGALTVSFTGLTASTQYYAHYVHRDAAGNDSNVVNSAAFTTAADVAQVAYTIAGYAGNTVKTTLDISNTTNFPTYNGYRNIIPANTGSSTQYPVYWAVNATSGGAQPNSAKAAWSTSSTVAPDEAVMTYLAGNTNASVLPGGAVGVYVTMTKGVAFDIGNLTLWVLAGAGTVTRSLWIKPENGVAQMVGTMTITGA